MKEILKIQMSNKNNENNKYAGAIAAAKQLTEALEKLNIPSEELTKASSTIANSLLKIDTSYYKNISEGLVKLSKSLNTVDFQEQGKELSRIASATVDAWNLSIGSDAVKMMASNIASIKLIDLDGLDIPRGGKTLLKSLNTSTAYSLLEPNELHFDSASKKFYLEDAPEHLLSSKELNVINSSVDLFGDITFNELVEFETILFNDPYHAMEEEVGKKISSIINKWNNFIHFEKVNYFHGRKLSDGASYYLDDDMLKAPRNVTSQGRYNDAGISCYYFTDDKDMAISEVRKHSRNCRLQVNTLKPIKEINMIDLSMLSNKANVFLEHLRKTVDNTEGQRHRAYLLSNFVASCCKRAGIEGIKYRTGKNICYVTWKDDYFESVNREVIDPVPEIMQLDMITLNS